MDDMDSHEEENLYGEDESELGEETLEMEDFFSKEGDF